MRIPTHAQWYLYSSLCITADVLDAIFALFYTQKQPEGSLKPSDIDSLSDEQMKKLALNQLRDDSSLVFRLPYGKFGKLSCDWFDDDPPDCSEVNIYHLVSEKTNIPVPRVRRVIKRKGDYLIVMDDISGPTLTEVWPTYSVWTKIRVVFTLRRYVRQLRRLEAPLGTPPGPLSRHGPQACHVPNIFGGIRPMRGPFRSYEELTEFFNYRYRLGLNLKEKLPEDHPWMIGNNFDNSSPLVITHNDLNPRHIIVGEDGRLWIVDWAWSGYYPPWFEYAAMANQVTYESLVIGGWYDRSWELAVPFICGPSFQQHNWLGRAGLGLDFL